jgi:nucleolar complex protein 3
MAEDPFEASDTDDTLSDRDSQSSLHDSDDEMPYETNPRIRRPSWDIEDKPAIKRLPIKLADGHIRQTGVRFSALHSAENERQQPEEKASQDPTRVEDVSTGARFGRAAVVDVVGIQSKKERIQRAKEQIAGICQEILSDPENNVSCIECIKSVYLLTQ